jgi:putative transposase
MVWTTKNRGRYDRRGQRYPSDLNNKEWAVLESLLPVANGRERPRQNLLREIMNGIRYVLRYGIPWDAMPKDLTPSSIYYDYWRLLSDRGHMERINHELVMVDREKEGREASPSLVIIDARSVKYDAPKVTARKSG